MVPGQRMVLLGKRRRVLVKSSGDMREHDQIYEGYQEFEKAEKRSGLSFPMLDLEINLIYEILSRLPIRSIFVCRCVCKKFLKILKFDPYFAQLHLTRAPATASLVIQRTTLGRNILAFYTFDLDQGFRAPNCSIDCQHTTCHTKNPLNAAMAKQNPTLWFLNKSATLVGECNGLLCLYSNSPVGLYLICNPILGEYVSVPYSPLATLSYSDSVHSGFGYCPNSGHYKVIHFARLISIDPLTSLPTREIIVDILTLGSNSWRRIQDAPYPRFQESFDHLLNGSFHWITQDHKPAELLLSLDLESECFTFLPPPAHFSTYHIMKISYMNLGVFRGSLCLCYVYKNSQFEVWVMKEYGVKESWTKEFSIDINFYSGLRDVDFQMPLKFLKNGELWLRYSFNCLVSYNPQTRTFKEFDILEQFPSGIILYHPSFISLKHAVEGKNLEVVKVGRDKLAMISLV